MIGRLAPVLALCVAVAAGCSEPLTEAVVRVSSDLTVPDELDEVRFQVDTSAIDERSSARGVTLGDGGAQLPVTLTLVHDGGALGPVEVTAIGLRQGTEIVSRTARFHFLRGRTLTVQLDLDRRCISPGCETVLPDGGGDAGTAPSLDGGPVTEPGRSDAGPAPEPDAGEPVCPAGCACTMGCGSTTCHCSTGCPCTFTCTPGEDCEKVYCEGVGTTCELDAHEGSNVRDIRCDEGATCEFDGSGASNVAVKCEHGSSCFVDCTNVTNCEVQCKDSSCLVECAGTSECDILECDGEVLRCGTQLACGRACP